MIRFLEINKADYIINFGIRHPWLTFSRNLPAFTTTDLHGFFLTEYPNVPMVSDIFL